LNWASVLKVVVLALLKIVFVLFAISSLFTYLSSLPSTSPNDALFTLVVVAYSCFDVLAPSKSKENRSSHPILSLDSALSNLLRRDFNFVVILLTFVGKLMNPRLIYIFSPLRVLSS